LSKQPDTISIEKLLRYKDPDGYTALHRSAYSNNLDIVKYILSFEKHNHISNLNQLQVQTDMGWTPLHSAVYWNCFKVVEFLIKHPNVNVNWRSGSGQTSLHLTASQSSHRETILLLLTHLDIRYDIKNDQGETAHTIADRSCKYNALFEIADENLIKLF
jgi:ankyrin repeat protein